jgi:hypothetical protein
MIEKSELLRVPAFADLPDDQIAWFLSQSQEMRLKAGETYVRQGVYEYPAIGPGNDTCFFKGSKVALFDTITTPGFAWDISSKNAWGGADFIGWNLAAVRYYRTEKARPVHHHLPAADGHRCSIQPSESVDLRAIH